MRRFALLCSLLLLPASVIAADSLEYLLDDAERFEEELKRMETETLWDASEDAEMQSSELLPVSDEAEEDKTETREALSDEGTMFVRIKVDGVPVDLSDVPKDTWFAPYVRSAVGKWENFWIPCRGGGWALRSGSARARKSE